MKPMSDLSLDLCRTCAEGDRRQLECQSSGAQDNERKRKAKEKMIDLDAPDEAKWRRKINRKDEKIRFGLEEMKGINWLTKSTHVDGK